MKRSRTTALLLMGSAPLLFTACQQDTPVKVQEGLYTSVQSCTDATGDPSACRTAFAQAQARAADSAPQYASREDCARDYPPEQCVSQHTSAGHSFIGPMMTGFFLSRMLDAGRAGSPMPPAAPAFRDKDQQWGGAGGGYYGGSSPRDVAARAEAQGKSRLAPIAATPDHATTMSRGGFGHAGNARGSFGG